MGMSPELPRSRAPIHAAGFGALVHSRAQAQAQEPARPPVLVPAEAAGGAMPAPGELAAAAGGPSGGSPGRGGSGDDLAPTVSLAAGFGDV